MSYALQILWYERQRYFAAILAVGFSTVLICIQMGLLHGMFALTSLPIDDSQADLWVGSPDVVSVDVGKHIPANYLERVLREPEVVAAEPYALGFDYWEKPDGGTELCIVVGTRLHSNSLGAVKQLTPEMRSLLTQPMAVVIDQSELGRLGVRGVGDMVRIRGHQARVVGLVKGLSGLQGPYVFCSLPTARQLLGMSQDQAVYILAKCRDKADVGPVVERLRQRYSNMSTLSSEELSWRSRQHWVTKTNAGIALGFAAVLGLLVGAAVTRQSIYSAIIASLREYAMLRALGIPRWRLASNILWLAFWIGLAGVVAACPVVVILVEAAHSQNVPVDVPWWLAAAAVLVTWAMAILSGLTTLRALQRSEPILLLR
jgi:putative ABC transport system permease protein